MSTSQPAENAIVDEGQMATSWIAYPPEKASSQVQAQEALLTNSRACQQEEEYTLPVEMRHGQNQLNNETDVEDTTITSNVPAQCQDDVGYASPITMTRDIPRQERNAPQPMPEYTLPVKKRTQESSPTGNAKISEAIDDYLLPSTMRPDPIGANITKPSDCSEFTGSCLSD